MRITKKNLFYLALGSCGILIAVFYVVISFFFKGDQNLNLSYAVLISSYVCGIVVIITAKLVK